MATLEDLLRGHIKFRFWHILSLCFQTNSFNVFSLSLLSPRHLLLLLLFLLLLLTCLSNHIKYLFIWLEAFTELRLVYCLLAVLEPLGLSPPLFAVEKCICIWGGGRGRVRTSSRAQHSLLAVWVWPYRTGRQPDEAVKSCQVKSSLTWL